MGIIKDNMERKIKYDKFLSSNKLANVFDNWSDKQVYISRINKFLLYDKS